MGKNCDEIGDIILALNVIPLSLKRNLINISVASNELKLEVQNKQPQFVVPGNCLVVM